MAVSGKGIFFYKNGNRYEGEWKNDKRHGLGTLYVLVEQENKLRVQYSGVWTDDKPCVSSSSSFSAFFSALPFRMLTNRLPLSGPRSVL